MPTFVIHFTKGQKLALSAPTAIAAREEGERQAKARDLGFITKVKVQKGGAS